MTSDGKDFSLLFLERCLTGLLLFCRELRSATAVLVRSRGLRSLCWASLRDLRMQQSRHRLQLGNCNNWF